MRVHNTGTLVELDPNKMYLMVVKRSAGITPGILERCLKKSGHILFVNELSDIRFVENSDRITDVILED